jgi:hypothetical protein
VRRVFRSIDLRERAGVWSRRMRIVVTSASGANGDGQGDLLAFDLSGLSLGAFAPDAAIVDPRGLQVHPDGKHLYVNNGDDRILLLDERGGLVASTVPIERLNPGGGVIGPDGRYCVGSRGLRTILAFSASLSGPAMPLVRLAGSSFRDRGLMEMKVGSRGLRECGAWSATSTSAHPTTRMGAHPGAHAAAARSARRRGPGVDYRLALLRTWSNEGRPACRVQRSGRAQVASPLGGLPVYRVAP